MNHYKHKIKCSYNELTSCEDKSWSLWLNYTTTMRDLLLPQSENATQKVSQLDVNHWIVTTYILSPRARLSPGTSSCCGLCTKWVGWVTNTPLFTHHWTAGLYFTLLHFLFVYSPGNQARRHLCRSLENRRRFWPLLILRTRNTILSYFL